MAGGMYCPTCGQETSLALPTVRAMLREAAGRYVALDGRMWRTLAALLFRPGFLTREYLAGRRRRYIRPARLFLVLSLALFALLHFVGGPLVINDEALTQAERDEIARDAADADEHSWFNVDPDLKFHLNMPAASWLVPLQRRIDTFNQLSRHGRGEQIGAGLLRYGPYAAFVLLPLFALLLKIVYVGRGRRYPSRPRRYVAHLIFGAHSHAFLFLGRHPDGSHSRCCRARRARRLGDRLSAPIDEDGLRRPLDGRDFPGNGDFRRVLGVLRYRRRRSRGRRGLARLTCAPIVE